MTVLRDFEPRDIEAYTHWLQPNHAWQDWDGPWEHQTPERIQAALAVARGTPAEPRHRMVIQSDAGDLIGTVARYRVEGSPNRIGVGIDLYESSSWGRGIGRAALEEWRDYLFGTWPVLVVQTWSGNERMCRLAIALGFREVERVRDAREVRGGRYDAVTYELAR